jgi:transcriptional regulator with XRE-family HTH domain
MRYVYLIVTLEKYNPARAKMERKICGIRYKHIAEATGSTPATIQRWERNGTSNLHQKPSTIRKASSYRRMLIGMHNHASEGYCPCPTLIRLAPHTWTKYKLMLVKDYLMGEYDV